MNKLFAIVFASIVSVTIQSCTDVTTTPVEPQEMRSTSGIPEIPNFQPIELGERPNKDTTKKDTTEKKRDTTKNDRRDSIKKAPPTIFGDLLVRLELTPEQKTIVEKLLIEHRACTDACVKVLKDAEREVLTAAGAREQEIKNALKEGKITAAQARERLSALKKSINEKLRNLPVRARVMECIKSCDETFISKLGQILKEKQKAVLKTWLDSRKKRSSTGKKDTVVVKPRG